MTSKPLIRNPAALGLKEIQLLVADVVGAEPETGMWYDMSALAYETTLSYALSTRTLSVVPTGATWRVWVQGLLFTFTGTQTISHAATQGLWYIYVDAAGTLTASQTLWNILDVAPIALVYYDATTPDYWLLDERHHFQTPVEWHKSQHFAIGTFVKTPASDFPLGGYTLGTATNAGVQWTLGTGTVVDEDIELVTAAIAAAGPYQLFAKIGAAGNFIRTSSVLPYLWNGSNRWLQWNQNVAGTWQLTDTNSADRVNYYIFGTTGYDSVTPKQILIIAGQADYSSLAAAQAESVANLDLTGFPSAEYVPLYQVTLHTVTDNANNGRCSIEGIQKIFNTRVSAGSAPAGMINPMNAIGQVIAGSTSGSPVAVAGNTTTIKKPLVSQGTGSAAQLPTFVQLASSDLSDGPFVTAATFTASTAGLVPASGGGTSNFLRADGTFAAPPGGSGSSEAQNLFTADVTVNSGYSQYFVGPIQTNGHVLDIEGGLVGVI